MHRTILLILFAACLAGLVAVRTFAQAPDAAFEQRFREWDRNADGKLTPDEVPGEKLFKVFDRNGDGAVTREEAAVKGRDMAAQKLAGRTFSIEEATPLPPPENFKPRPHGAEVAMAGLKADVLAKIDIEIQRHIDAKNVVGVAAAICKNGVQGYCETFGMADIEEGRPASRDSIFRLASLTKPVVVAAALTLLDEGRFTLDEPIARYCPEWAEPKVLENGVAAPAKSAITPRMLMSHSSGLGYGSDDSGVGQAVGEEDVTELCSAMRGIGTTLKEFSEAAAKVPLKFQPGAGYNYGIGFDILGRYLEAVAGKPLDEVLKERLFVPLKMADTDFWVPPEKADRLCQSYKQLGLGKINQVRDAEKLIHKPTLFLGGQGLCGTIADYERFCSMLLNRGRLDGVRVLKSETVELMFKNQLKKSGIRYGLGGVVDGEGGYGWGCADGTLFWVDRKNKLLALYLVQPQMYKTPTCPAFRELALEAAGIAGARTGWFGGIGGGTNSLFKQRDRNNNGKLERNELSPELFGRLDADKNGVVTENELKALWKDR